MHLELIWQDWRTVDAASYTSRQPREPGGQHRAGQLQHDDGAVAFFRRHQGDERLVSSPLQPGLPRRIRLGTAPTHFRCAIHSFISGRCCKAIIYQINYH